MAYSIYQCSSCKAIVTDSNSMVEQEEASEYWLFLGSLFLLYLNVMQLQNTYGWIHHANSLKIPLIAIVVENSYFANAYFIINNYNQ